MCEYHRTFKSYTLYHVLSFWGFFLSQSFSSTYQLSTLSMLRLSEEMKIYFCWGNSLYSENFLSPFWKRLLSFKAHSFNKGSKVLKVVFTASCIRKNDTISGSISVLSSLPLACRAQSTELARFFKHFSLVNPIHPLGFSAHVFPTKFMTTDSFEMTLKERNLYCVS